MKKSILASVVVSLVLGTISYAQNWRVGGNTNAQLGGNPPNLGTTQNTPLNFITNGVNRMHINQNRNAAIGGVFGGFNVITNGYVGIGPNTGNIWTNKGPFSLLHLNGGQVGAFGGVQEFGFRPWMQTGISFTAFNDFAYVGYRNVTGNTNEFVINWSNDQTTMAGPDDMVFRFTSGYDFSAPDPNPNPDPLARIDNNFTLPDDMDGRHIARFTPTGEFGLGPNFGYTFDNAAYIRPQSMFHMSTYQQQEAWMQVTNQTGTGETTNDGLRIGIEQGTNSSGFLRWQEASPFIIQTQNVGNPNLNSERIRITTNLGNPNPYNPEGDNTRVAISNRGEENITLIRSLLHLGYNTGLLINDISATDGWRNWMDVGTFTNNGRENMYVGLKQEEIEGGGIGFVPYPSARFDAVINWGDNEPVPSDGRYNNLRFIYTTPETTTNNQPHTAWNGLETMRIEPTVATTLAAPNFGMVGIGDFSPQGPNTASADIVDAKLDIDGDLRIRTVTEDTTLLQVLVIDPNDHNRVHWRDVSSIGGGTGGTVTANNGLRIFPANSGNVQLGGDLIVPTVVNLNNNNLNFAGLGRVGIGTLATSMLNIQNTGNWTNVLRISNSTNAEMLTFDENRKLTIRSQRVSGEQAIYMENTIVNSPGTVATLYGLDVYTTSTDVSNPYTGARVRMEAISDKTITGLFVAARSKPENQGTSNYIGIYATADRGTTGENIGVWGSSGAVSSRNIGVKGTGLGTGNFGGYFEGALHVTGQISSTNGTIVLSDQQFKTNINALNNASSIINQLQPKVYNLDSVNFSQFGFDNKQHMGLIAQDVELILPNLVSNNVILAQTDSLGNEITPQVNYKGLNYQELIPLMIAGMKEQQSELHTKDSLLNNLQSEINYIKECLLNARICEEGNRTINQNPTTETNQKSIELINTNSIILDQNLPNPFAENTVINYNIPTDVVEAKLMFYDLNGRIIKELIIEERGESKLTVYGTNLKTGVYTYSLIADGELIATKKMVKK